MHFGLNFCSMGTVVSMAAEEESEERSIAKSIVQCNTMPSGVAVHPSMSSKHWEGVLSRVRNSAAESGCHFPARSATGVGQDLLDDSPLRQAPDLVHLRSIVLQSGATELLATSWIPHNGPLWSIRQ